MFFSRLTNYFRWAPTSEENLDAAEADILSEVASPLRRVLVPCGVHDGTQSFLHTVVLDQSDGPAMVCMHGWGAGSSIFFRNMDQLAMHFKVYCVDWLGFGRSSRPAFRGRTTEEAEAYWADSLEEWRKSMGLETFTLVGHSLGSPGLDFSLAILTLIL